MTQCCLWVQLMFVDIYLRYHSLSRQQQIDKSIKIVSIFCETAYIKYQNVLNYIRVYSKILERKNHTKQR